MNVKQVAELVGISIRTLHHYDEIGLLTPDHVTEAGYRQYSESNLQALQHILFFKELGFSLKEIQSMLNNPQFNTLEALQLQRRSLLSKQAQINKMIKTIDLTIAYEKGEKTMSVEQKFDGLQWDHNPYEQEAREKWGNSVVEESLLKISHLGEEQRIAIQQEWNEIYTGLASRIDQPVESDQTVELIGRWYKLLNQLGNYSYDAFIGLGQMYLYDERFKANIDQYGEGLTTYLSEAMTYWGQQQKNKAK